MKKYLLFFFIVAISISCKEKVNLEKLKEDAGRKLRIDTELEVKEQLSMKNIFWSDLIGKKLKTKFFQYAKSQLVMGDTVFTNDTTNNPTQKWKLKFNEIVIHKSKNTDTLKFKGQYAHNCFVAKVNSFCFYLTKANEYKVYKYDENDNLSIVYTMLEDD